MAARRIEVRDRREMKEKGRAHLSLAAFFLSLPWCCIMPAALALLGFLGAAGMERLLYGEILIPLFVVSLLLLGRAHYLVYFKKQGSAAARALVWGSTVGALALWAFRFGLVPL